MQPFRPLFLRKDSRDIVREMRADMDRLNERKAEIARAIIESRARLADTREILKRIDAALVRFNGLR